MNSFRQPLKIGERYAFLDYQARCFVGTAVAPAAAHVGVSLSLDMSFMDPPAWPVIHIPWHKLVAIQIADTPADPFPAALFRYCAQLTAAARKREAP